MDKVIKLLIAGFLGILLLIIYKDCLGKIYVCITIDLESDVDFDKDHFEGLKEVPYELFNIFDRNGLKGKITWLVQADRNRNIFLLYPDLIKEIKERGDEIGLHLHNIDKMSQKELRYLIEKAKMVANKFNLTLYSFRAGSFRYNPIATRLLEVNGFKVDLSGYPNNHVRIWYKMPRTPYYLDYRNPHQEGNSKILEIPVGVDPKGSRFACNLYTSLKLSQKIFDGYFKNKDKDVFFVIYFHNWNAMKINYTGDLFGIDKNWLNKLDSLLKYIKLKGANFITTYQARKIWINSKNRYVDYWKPSLFRSYLESIRISITEGKWIVYKLKRTGKFKTYCGIFLICILIFSYLMYLAIKGIKRRVGKIDSYYDL